MILQKLWIESKNVKTVNRWKLLNQHQNSKIMIPLGTDFEDKIKNEREREKKYGRRKENSADIHE